MESELRRPSPPLPAHDWALFLDVDGCLLDFAPHPSGVIVPAGLQQHILRLAAKLDGALALVSGRSLDAIDAVFDELRALPAAGMGLEGALPPRAHMPPSNPFCRHASNTTTAIAFDRFKLRFPGRIGRRNLCVPGTSASTSSGNPRVSGPNSNASSLAYATRS